MRRLRIKMADKPPINKGAVIWEQGNSVENKTGGWRSKRPRIIQDKCKKCGTCWKVCPDNAAVKLDDGKYDINYDFCKGCLLCYHECPFDAIEEEDEEK